MRRQDNGISRRFAAMVIVPLVAAGSAGTYTPDSQRYVPPRAPTIANLHSQMQIPIYSRQVPQARYLQPPAKTHVPMARYERWTPEDATSCEKNPSPVASWELLVAANIFPEKNIDALLRAMAKQHTLNRAMQKIFFDAPRAYERLASYCDGHGIHFRREKSPGNPNYNRRSALREFDGELQDAINNRRRKSLPDPLKTLDAELNEIAAGCDADWQWYVTGKGSEVAEPEDEFSHICDEGCYDSEEPAK